jgi:hypothetical protein
MPLATSLLQKIVWRDRMDVPSEYTIVKTIEQVGPAYRQRRDAVSSSWQSKDNNQKEDP